MISLNIQLQYVHFAYIMKYILIYTDTHTDCIIVGNRMPQCCFASYFGWNEKTSPPLMFFFWHLCTTMSDHTCYFRKQTGRSGRWLNNGSSLGLLKFSRWLLTRQLHTMETLLLSQGPLFIPWILFIRCSSFTCTLTSSWHSQRAAQRCSG